MIVPTTSQMRTIPAVDLGHTISRRRRLSKSERMAQERLLMESGLAAVQQPAAPEEEEPVAPLLGLFLSQSKTGAPGVMISGMDPVSRRKVTLPASECGLLLL